MDTPLLPARRHAFADRFVRRQRPPADPPPEELARILRDNGVHRTAAKRLDLFEIAETQHHDQRRAKTCLLLGTAGPVLGLTPSVPAVHGACFAGDPGWECGLRATALAGGFLALSDSIISAWSLWHQRSKLERHAQKLSDTLARAMHSKNGHAPVDDVFHRFRAYSAEGRRQFSHSLHAFAQEHREALAQAGSSMAAV